MRTFLLSILIIALLAPLALAENTELGEGRWFTLYNSENKVLLRTGIRIHVGDRFLDSDNCLYHVYKVDAERLRAWAREVDNEEARAVSPVQGLQGQIILKLPSTTLTAGKATSLPMV